jgi:hypothetical protein
MFINDAWSIYLVASLILNELADTC